MQTILNIIVFAAGFAASWFCKDSVLRLVSGADALIEALEAKLAALRAKS